MSPGHPRDRRRTSAVRPMFLSCPVLSCPVLSLLLKVSVVNGARAATDGAALVTCSETSA